MKIRKEDVYEHLEMLYEIVGDEKYLEIIRMYGGSNLYIPTYYPDQIHISSLFS